MNFEAMEGNSQEKTPVSQLSWQELETLAVNGTANDVEVAALKLQAQLRLEDLNRSRLEAGAEAIPLEAAMFEVDANAKQVYRAQAADETEPPV